MGWRGGGVGARGWEETRPEQSKERVRVTRRLEREKRGIRRSRETGKCGNLRETEKAGGGGGAADGKGSQVSERRIWVRSQGDFKS
jgi:hypothetical protein